MTRHGDCGGQTTPTLRGMTMRKTLITLFVSLMTVAFTLVGGPPAQAHHSGPYVANRIAHTVDVLVRNHSTGLRFWQYVASNTNSSRGAEGVFVYQFNKLYYQSIATGARYWSLCGRSYAGQGYTWNGKPYMPMNPDRSIIILEDTYRSECAW
jgi:hypothetical protein